MSWWYRLLYLLRRLNRDRAERELEEEIESHLDLEASEQAERGASRLEACHTARRAFGNVTIAREESRRYWTLASWLGQAVQDLRYAIRTLGRDWAVTTVAVVSIAFAVGANSAVFSVVDAVFFRPLPGIVQPENLVSLYGDDRSTPEPDWASISYPVFSMVSEDSAALENVAAYCRLPFNLTTAGDSESVVGELVSKHYFELLGPQAKVGRLFQEEDHSKGAPLTAVVSRRLWRRLGDEGVLGQNLQLNGQPAQIIGVVEEGFGGLLLDWHGPADIWLPITSHASFFGRDLSSSYSPWLMMAGRLVDGGSIAQAKLDIHRIGLQLEGLDPVANKDKAISLISSNEARFWPGHKDSITRLLAALAGAGGFVLVVACINVAGLLLARAVTRHREIAVRLALGASAGRVVRQVLTEQAPLVALSSLLGLVLAWGVLQALAAFENPFRIGLDAQPQLDLRVLVFTLAVSVTGVALAGVLPALRVAHSPLAPGIRDVVSVWRSKSGRFSLQKMLLVAQVSLATVVLVGTGLFLGSLRYLYSVDPGFAVQNVAVSKVHTGVYTRDDERVHAFYRNLIRQARELPGVSSVALAQDVLLTSTRREVTVAAGNSRVDTELRVPTTKVSPRYFETLGIPARQGKVPATSSSNTLDGVVINESLARQLWGRENAVGRYLKVGDTEQRVLAVVADIRHRDLFELPRPHLYQPFAGDGLSGAFFFIRHAGAPSHLARELKREVRRLDGGVVVSGLKTMEQHVATRLSGQRLLAVFTTFLGIGVLLLAAAGIFSLAAFIVSQGQREIGIRKAIGEDSRSISTRIMGQGLKPCAAGLVVGLVAAVGLSRFVESQLHGIQPTEPIVFVGVCILLLATTVAACYLPARWAAAVDPIRTLRHD